MFFFTKDVKKMPPTYAHFYIFLGKQKGAITFAESIVLEWQKLRKKNATRK